MIKDRYRVVKIKEEIHLILKHKAVDMKTSIQEIVERALLEYMKGVKIVDFLETENMKRRRLD